MSKDEADDLGEEGNEDQADDRQPGGGEGQQLGENVMHPLLLQERPGRNGRRE